METVRHYNNVGTISGITVPAGTTHVQAYITGSGAPGVNGNGQGDGGRGGGGGAFAQYDTDSTPSSTYSVTIPASGQATFEHLKDNQATTGQSLVVVGGATGKQGAPASSCQKSGYDSVNGTLSNIHKGGDGSDNPGNGKGGGGGGGGRVVVDGATATDEFGCGLGGGNGGIPGSSPHGQAGASVATGASNNTGGGGGGGSDTGNGNIGSPGYIRVTITH